VKARPDPRNKVVRCAWGKPGRAEEYDAVSAGKNCRRRWSNEMMKSSVCIKLARVALSGSPAQGRAASVAATRGFGTLGAGRHGDAANVKHGFQIPNQNGLGCCAFADRRRYRRHRPQPSEAIIVSAARGKRRQPRRINQKPGIGVRASVAPLS
jgi:hypothetical protein